MLKTKRQTLSDFVTEKNKYIKNWKVYSQLLSVDIIANSKILCFHWHFFSTYAEKSLFNMQKYFAARLLLFLNLHLKVASRHVWVTSSHKFSPSEEKGFWRVPGILPLIYKSNFMILGFERIPTTLILSQSISVFLKQLPPCSVCWI